MIVAFAMAGCEDPPDKIELGIRNAPAERTFKGVLAGKPAHLVMHDCVVYSVSTPSRRKLEWVKVLEPDPNPFLTFCERQSLSVEKGTVTVTVGRVAFGAGGCCVSGGTYRSADGREWQKVP